MLLFVVAVIRRSGQEPAAGAVLAGLGIVLVWLDPRRLPADVATVGDLVRRIAPLNALWLRSTGRRPADSWTLLAAIAAEHCTVPPREIGPETRLTESRERGKKR